MKAITDMYPSICEEYHEPPTEVKLELLTDVDLSTIPEGTGIFFEDPLGITTLYNEEEGLVAHLGIEIDSANELPDNAPQLNDQNMHAGGGPALAQLDEAPFIDIPTASEIAEIAILEARQIYDGMKRNKSLTENGAAEKYRKVVTPCAARHALPYSQAILSQYRWTYEEIEAASPKNVRSVPIYLHHHYLLNLFQPTDVIWCGHVDHTGPQNFRIRDEWLAQKGAMPPLTCPSAFNPGVFRRTKENVLHRRFLVVESDTLDRDTVGAIFRWLSVKCELKLRAVVDTGGKSLHAWFDNPGDEILKHLKLILPPLGCDKQLFVPTQPCRMPGIPRGADRYQKLIFID